MKIEEIIEELVMYYEAAGFADFYQKELKNKSEDEIKELYRINILEKNK